MLMYSLSLHKQWLCIFGCCIGLARVNRREPSSIFGNKAFFDMDTSFDDTDPVSLRR